MNSASSCGRRRAPTCRLGSALAGAATLPALPARAEEAVAAAPMPDWAWLVGLLLVLVVITLVLAIVFGWQLARRRIGKLLAEVAFHRETALRFRELAMTDPLTGAANRRAFLERAEAAFALAVRYDRPLAVLMIDIDRFKTVNDRHGHDAGDAVLQALVRVTQKVLRRSDLLGRLGGEEFAALLPETDGVRALRAAERVRERIAAAAAPTPKGAIRFTVSVGLASRRPETASLAALLKGADRALYAAKAAGRDCVIDAATLPAEPAAPAAS